MNKNLKRKIMVRIYLEYAKNQLWQHPDYFMFALFLITSFALVSIHDVITNIPHDNFYNIFNFFLVALRDTSLIIQVFIGGFILRTLISGGILLYKSLNSRRFIAGTMKLKH